MKTFKQFLNEAKIVSYTQYTEAVFDMFARFRDNKNIHWLDTNEVHKMAAPEPTQMSKEEYDDLWKELNTVGMKTPLEILISDENNRMRLDSGNHRIQLFKKYSISPVPCTIEKVKNQIQSPSNGKHKGVPIE